MCVTFTNGVHKRLLVWLLLECVVVHDRHATVGIYRLGTHANARLVLNLQRYAL